MDDSRRIVAYRRMRSGEVGDVWAGSPLQMGHLVYSFHSEFHLKSQRKSLDEGIDRLTSPYFPCWIWKASRGERGPARAMQDAQNCQI